MSAVRHLKYYLISLPMDKRLERLNSFEWDSLFLKKLFSIRTRFMGDFRFYGAFQERGGMFGRRFKR